jgi:hypothetical protein
VANGLAHGPGCTILLQVAAQACANPDFKAQLLANPNRVLAQGGLTIPPGVTVTIHENNRNELHMVLPCAQDLPPGAQDPENVVHVFSITHMF